MTMLAVYPVSRPISNGENRRRELCRIHACDCLYLLVERQVVKSLGNRVFHPGKPAEIVFHKIFSFLLLSSLFSDPSPLSRSILGLI